MGCGCGKSKFSKTNNSGVARRSAAPAASYTTPGASSGKVIQSAEMRKGAVTTPMPLKRTSV